MLLTVATAASEKNLLSLERIKRELGIEATTHDALLEDLIAEASDAIATECNLAPDQLGRRGFAAEELAVTFDAEEARTDSGEPLVLPWRIPVTAIAVEEDGTDLVAADWQLEPMSGLLYRMRGGCRSAWCGLDLAIEMTAGWDLAGDDVPKGLAKACLILVKGAWFARRRDPLIKAEDIPGVLATQWWVGSTGETPGQLPAEVRTLLDPYRSRSI